MKKAILKVSMLVLFIAGIVAMSFFIFLKSPNAGATVPGPTIERTTITTSDPPDSLYAETLMALDNSGNPYIFFHNSTSYFLCNSTLGYWSCIDTGLTLVWRDRMAFDSNRLCLNKSDCLISPKSV